MFIETLSVDIMSECGLCGQWTAATHCNSSLQTGAWPQWSVQLVQVVTLASATCLSKLSIIKPYLYISAGHVSKLLICYSEVDTNLFSAIINTFFEK